VHKLSQVDLIIPTYNGRELLRNCLIAVQKQTLSRINVIVVDDGSTDGTEQMLRVEFPDVLHLRLPGNFGFAAACNAGIGAGSAEFVALLNNDAIPEPDWLKCLADGMKRYPGAGALASKILLADGSGRLHAAGDTFSRSGLSNSRGVWEYDHGQYEREEQVFSACAAAVLYRRCALEHASLVTGSVFDSDFFMYCEDIDLGWRLRLLGYEIFYVPGARVAHHLSSTGGGPLASYRVARNGFAVLAKNLPSELQTQIWRRFLVHQVHVLMRTLPRVREPAARARIRGTFAGPWFALKQRPKRRKIQETRTADLSEIGRLLLR
jgi:GT2 family glycosyltransferase